MKLIACIATKDAAQIHPSVIRRFQSNRLMVSTMPGWVNAANELLSKAARRRDHDGILFLDDDIELTDTSLELLGKYQYQADIIGFSLFKPTASGLVPQSCGHQFVPHGSSVILMPLNSPASLLTPAYCAHVTASCMYVSRQVLKAGIQFPVWEGAHYEDVAFSIRGWMHGFKTAYVPGLVIHHFGVSAGRTKDADAEFEHKRRINERRLQEWYREIDLVDLCAKGIVPLGSKRIELFS